MRIWMIGVAFVLDVLLGDPYSWPHPVKIMGNYIQAFLDKSGYQNQSQNTQILYGGLLTTSLLVITASVCGGVLYLSKGFSDVLYFAVGTYLIYTCYSVKCLSSEAIKVIKAVEKSGLVAGRQQLAMIVGRDTSELTESEIYKAVIETVAENTTDGFISPLFYTVLLGPVGGMVYKVINTLDSMVGYRYLPYTYIGRISAKLDDLANYIPARIGYYLFIMASYGLKYNYQGARSIGWRDKYNHLSPNSGWSEAPVAGALGIQLGGGHMYKGNYVDKPTIGDDLHEVTKQDIYRTIRLLYGVAILMVLLSSIGLLIGGIYG